MAIESLFYHLRAAPPGYLLLQILRHLLRRLFVGRRSPAPTPWRVIRDGSGVIAGVRNCSSETLEAVRTAVGVRGEPVELALSLPARVAPGEAVMYWRRHRDLMSGAELLVIRWRTRVHGELLWSAPVI